MALSWPVLILLVVIAVIVLGLVTWIASKTEDDDWIGKILWTCAQLSCLLVILFFGWVMFVKSTKEPVPASAEDTPVMPMSGNRRPPIHDSSAPKPKADIVVTVTDESTGQPLAGIAVQVQFTGEPSVLSATTNAAGAATFAGEPTGARVVVTATESQSGRTVNETEQGGFSPGKNDVKLVLPAITSCTLSGAFVDGATGEPMTGSIELDAADGRPVMTSGASGRYSLSNIPPGSYTVKFTAGDKSWTSQVELSLGLNTLDAKF